MSDSPLSIAASITGLLTFFAAVVAAFYAHALGLRDAIDTQAEVSSALDKIYLLETETDMLNNAYLASRIRQPDRKYGIGDFKYFQGLYVQSLERMRVMDRELRASVELVTKGDGYGRISRVKRKAAWMASRTRIQKDIDERKTESIRIFQIQLAMLSAGMMKMPPTPPSPTLSASFLDRTLTKINNHADISATPSQYHTPLKTKKDDIARISDLKDGGQLMQRHGCRTLNDSISEETLSSINVSSQCVVDIPKDTPKNIAIESSLGIPETKTPTVPPRRASLTNKRKSWYSISSKKSEGCKSSAIDQVNLCDQVGTLRDGKMAALQPIKQTQSDMPKDPSNDPVTIIVTSPTSDVNPQQEEWSPSCSSALSLSQSSLSSISSLATTQLMPPSMTSSTPKDAKSNEAPEVKKWLIGCMNRKADTLPRRLISRMMEMYNIKEDELDPRMLDKLREDIEDEGVVLQVDVEDEKKDNKKEEFDGVEALRCLRTSFRSEVRSDGKEKIEGKHLSGHFNDTVTTKRSSKSNNNNTNSKEQSPPKKVVPGTNPRVWQNSSSRARHWPTSNINISDGSSFAFPPCTHPSANSKHRTPSKPQKPYRPGNKNIYSTSTYSKRGICPPRRGSTISLSSIPEHDVSVGFDVKGLDEGLRGAKSRPRSLPSVSGVRKAGV
ncbi:hypothetical protein SBOR_7962 [Sclerotinia borealis F-4128]|uniref:Uncharacterized protein n=1 Tax=Sclerotinia borealis (strain F-4128) TaxID=1432307 RepID=W9C9X0_SCLBF|nr:hypothetical protein SBOR_7962 [Sclerotinia borealis F-4128]